MTPHHSYPKQEVWRKVYYLVEDPFYTIFWEGEIRFQQVELMLGGKVELVGQEGNKREKVSYGSCWVTPLSSNLFASAKTLSNAHLPLYSMRSNFVDAWFFVIAQSLSDHHNFGGAWDVVFMTFWFKHKLSDVRRSGFKSHFLMVIFKHLTVFWKCPFVTLIANGYWVLPVPSTTTFCVGYILGIQNKKSENWKNIKLFKIISSVIADSNYCCPLCGSRWGGLRGGVFMRTAN